MQWRDLVGVTRMQVVVEPLLRPPGSRHPRHAALGHYLLALGLSFMFFLTGLRLIHNAFMARWVFLAAVPKSCCGS